jgi:hypothetical protein
LRVLLELLRIIFIFLLLGGILWAFLVEIYSSFGFNLDDYGWLGGIAIYLLLFVLYRNKLQFSGWYTGNGREKLSKMTSLLLIWSSVLLMILPPLLSVILN